MTILDTVRAELLDEAQRSPQMLADLAGLERYVSESYSNRAFIELLQNSDDAGATELEFVLGDNWLAVANNGRRFNLSDFRSLCRSAASNKERGNGIGYRGIGFKSIVGITTQIHLYSGELETTFSRTLTSNAIGTDFPVPLIRIPHSLQLESGSSESEVAQKLLSSGYTTVFVLEGLNREQVLDEFDRFDSDYLIFLKSIESVNMLHSTVEHYSSRRRVSNDLTTEIETRSETQIENWRVFNAENVSVAFSIVENQYAPLRVDQSVVHAFLPTQEQCGFNIRVNGDFSTDPSRTRVVLDETSGKLITEVADVLAKLITDSMLHRTTLDPNPFLECLTPNVDETTLQLQRRSFRSELIGAVRERLTSVRNNVSLAPNWLSSIDAKHLTGNGKGLVLPQADSFSSEASVKISKFAGCAVITTRAVLESAEKNKLTVAGRADLIAHFANTVILNNVSIEDFSQAKIWEGPTGPVTIPEMIAGQHSMSPTFEKLLLDRGVELRSLSRRLAIADSGIFSEHTQTEHLNGDESADRTEITNHNNGLNGVISNPHLGIKSPSKFLRPEWHGAQAKTSTASNASQWRSAEITVLELLQSLGYEAIDHSRQNLGYDVIATLNSEILHVEVKSISYPGQPFSLTPNEDSYARDAADTYMIALVYRARQSTQIQLITDPRSSLNFVKQCRQWAWECSEYNFVPDYELDQT
ncbi:hypothetical protein CH281_12205 [Rhodococcus sp. 06-221-2]|nr:hypothetical protein CH281_12205 [Rhodococcus sp. 06-221-2]